MKLTKEQIQFYRDHGYVNGPRVLDDEQIERLKERMDGIFDGSIPFPELFRGVPSGVKGNPKFNKLVGIFRNDPVFAEVLTNPSISLAAHDLIEEPVRAWEDQAIAKAPGDDHGVVAWHRDYTYWDHVGPPDMTTCWMALDDATIENGCMQVIPDSHKWKLDYKRDDVDHDDPDWVLKRPDLPKGAKLEPMHCQVKAGHCHFHHCLTFHGSPNNLTDQPRRSYILHLLPGQTRRIGNSWNPRMARVEVVEIGQILKGPTYPDLVRP